MGTVVNTRKLKGKMIEKNYNVELLSEKMGINKATLYRKLDSEKFSIREASLIASILGLDKDEVNEIFFAETVAQHATRQQEEQHEQNQGNN